MRLNFEKLQGLPAYKNVPVTSEEVLSDSITDTTWHLTEAYYRSLAIGAPEARIVSLQGELTFSEAADEVAKRSEKGEEIVQAYKGLLNHIREIVVEED